MKITDEYRAKVNQMCSGHFLTEPYPDNFEELTSGEQNEFVEDHAWAPFEYMPANEVMSIIDAAAYETMAFIIREL